MTRQRPSLRSPDPEEDLRGFPIHRLTPVARLWRVVRDGRNPWWFSSSGGGRFDLPAPEGTCYLASDDLAALLEAVGPELLPGGLAPASLLEGRQLRLLSVPGPRRLANTLAGRAARWVTSEIGTITPYGSPQAWARAFRSHGLEGIRYSVRHSTSHRHWSVALFGRTGEEAWRRGRRIPIGPDHRTRLLSAHGVRLFEPPASDEVVFADL